MKSLLDFLLEKERTPERAIQILDRAMRFKAFHGKPYPAGRVTERPVMKVKDVTRFLPSHSWKEQTAMNKYFKEGPTTEVPVRDIIPIQHSVGPSGVKNKLQGVRKMGDDGSGPVHILQQNGKLYLVNGHHRFMAARLRKLERIPAKVYSP